MFEIIFTSISLIAFIVFLGISVLGKKDKSQKIIKNTMLIIIAFMQMALIPTSDLSGGAAHLIVEFMALYLLE